MQALPRIRLKLLQAQRNAAFLRVHVEHHGFHLVAHVHQLRRMLHALRPGHFADVDQAFDALFQFNECAVVGHADHAAMHARADRVALAGVQPRVGRQLLEAQRNPLLVAIELQNFYLDLIADVDQVTRMRQTGPSSYR